MSEPILPIICAWLKANDIEPRNVPTEAVPTIMDGQLTIHSYLRNANGRLYLDSGTGEPASTVITVPLKVEPSETLKQWIE